MISVYIYNNQTGGMEHYLRVLTDAMPYNVGKTLTVGEFLGSSNSTLVWSDRRFMDTWNSFRRYYGKPIEVGYAFTRIWDGGHTGQSQHYAGGAFDTAHDLTGAGRMQLYNDAVSFGGWSYVEPLYLTPTWVHFDKRLDPPSCTAGGYIRVERGSKGVYILILQDALNAIGFTGSGLDGVFGTGTYNAVRNFQTRNGLSADGIVGCQTWTALVNQASGIGQTATVVKP